MCKDGASMAGHPALVARSHEEYLALSEAERRAEDRGDPTGDWPDKPITYGLLTGDGSLGFVRSRIHEMRNLLEERGEIPLSERGIERLDAIPNLLMHFAAPCASDFRPLNLVANTLLGALSSDGYGRFRGTVAFTHSVCEDITTDQREQLIQHYRVAHRSVRAWQKRRNNGKRG